MPPLPLIQEFSIKIEQAKRIINSAGLNMDKFFIGGVH
jgi:hypothetical protein